jgi:hypothetical protein
VATSVPSSGQSNFRALASVDKPNNDDHNPLNRNLPPWVLTKPARRPPGGAVRVSPDRTHLPLERFMKAAYAALAALTLAATVLPAQPAAAGTTSLYRLSYNRCAQISISYTTQAEGSAYRISFSALNNWAWYYAFCGNEAAPYDGVLQWKGIQNGVSFGWKVAPDGYTNLPYYSGGSGFRDVRFRACNWNTTTGTIGTCGSS